MMWNRCVAGLTVCSAMTVGVVLSGSPTTWARSSATVYSPLVAAKQIASIIRRSPHPPGASKFRITPSAAQGVRQGLNRLAPRALPQAPDRASGPQADEFDANRFSAPFQVTCASRTTQPCPDPPSPSSWSLNGERPGYLRILTQFGSLLGSASQSSNNARNLILQPFDASVGWKAAIKLSFAKPTNNAIALGQTAGLIVYQDDDNFIFVGRVLAASGAMQIEFLQEAAGFDTVATVEEGQVIDPTVYLRLIKTGNMYQASYSDNGGPFVSILAGGTASSDATSGYTASYASPRVGLFAFGDLDPRVSTSVLPADFDWFRVGDGANSPPRPVPPPPKPHLSILDLRSYDNGRSSTTISYGHRTGFFARYRLVGAIPSRTGRAIFTLSTHAGTIHTYRVSLRGQRSGTVSVQVGSQLTVGRKKLSASIWIGKLHSAASMYFTVLNPPAFFLKPGPDLAEVTQVRTARVESDGLAQKEEYIFHLNHQSFRQEGRLTGYYEVLDLRWPSLDQSQEVIRADLVSVYGSAQRARTAFEARRGVYEAAAISRSAKLKVRSLGIASGLGDCCHAAYVTATSYGLHVEETFFVRGQILVEQWTWFTGGALSRSLSHAIENAFEAMSKTLDSIAWSQQQL